MTPDEHKIYNEKMDAVLLSEWGAEVRIIAREQRQRIEAERGKAFACSVLPEAATAFADVQAQKFDAQHRAVIRAYVLDAFFTDYAVSVRTNQTMGCA